MKNRFAKLYELGEYQLLVTTEYDHEDERHLVTMRTDVDGISIKISPSWDDNAEDKRQKFFEDFDQAQAEKIFASQFEQLIKMTGDEQPD